MLLLHRQRAFLKGMKNREKLDAGQKIESYKRYQTISKLTSRFWAQKHVLNKNEENNSEENKSEENTNEEKKNTSCNSNVHFQVFENVKVFNSNDRYFENIAELRMKQKKVEKTRVINEDVETPDSMKNDLHDSFTMWPAPGTLTSADHWGKYSTPVCSEKDKFETRRERTGLFNVSTCYRQLISKIIDLQSASKNPIDLKGLTTKDYFWVKTALDNVSFEAPAHIKSGEPRIGNFMYDEFFKTDTVMTNCLDSQHLLQIYDILKYVHESEFGRVRKFTDKVKTSKIDQVFALETNQKLSQVIMACRGQNVLGLLVNFHYLDNLYLFDFFS